MPLPTYMCCWFMCVFMPPKQPAYSHISSLICTCAHTWSLASLSTCAPPVCIYTAYPCFTNLYMYCPSLLHQFVAHPCPINTQLCSSYAPSVCTHMHCPFMLHQFTCVSIAYPCSINLIWTYSGLFSFYQPTYACISISQQLDLCLGHICLYALLILCQCIYGGAYYID